MYTKLNALISSNVKLDNFSTAIKLLENGFYLYRGDRTFKNELVLKKTKYRTSSNTTNIYTVLLSELLPSWKDYPKRNHCGICTTSKRKAVQYGDVIYTVFPENGALLAICPEKDLWDSFKYMSKLMFNDEDINLNMFNIYFIDVIDDLIDAFNIYSYKNNIPTLTWVGNYFKSNKIDKIKQTFNTLENGLLNNMQLKNSTYTHDEKTYMLKYLVNGIKNEHKTIISLLDEAFDPIKNSFKLVKIEDINNENLLNNEIWFDAPYILKKID